MLPWKDIGEQTTIYDNWCFAYATTTSDGSYCEARNSFRSGNLQDVTAPIGIAFCSASFTQEETEVLAVTGTDDHHGFHSWRCVVAQHFEAGDLFTGIHLLQFVQTIVLVCDNYLLSLIHLSDLGSSSTEHL